MKKNKTLIAATTTTAIKIYNHNKLFASPKNNIITPSFNYSYTP